MLNAANFLRSKTTLKLSINLYYSGLFRTSLYVMHFFNCFAVAMYMGSTVLSLFLDYEKFKKTNFVDKKFLLYPWKIFSVYEMSYLRNVPSQKCSIFKCLIYEMPFIKCLSLKFSIYEMFIYEISYL